MFYLDASFVGAVFLPEQRSEEAAAWLRDRADAEFYASDWLTLEFASAVARRVRMRSLSAEQGDHVVEVFRQWQSETCRIIEPDAADYAFAAAAVLKYETALRAGDALHLAVARNNGNLEIVTLDRGMARAAAMLGLPVATL